MNYVINPGRLLFLYDNLHYLFWYLHLLREGYFM